MIRKMYGARACNVCKASLIHCHITKLFVSPSALSSISPISPASSSLRSFSAYSNRTGVWKGGPGQVAWAQQRLSLEANPTSAFFSDNLPVGREELVSIMKTSKKEALLKDIEQSLGSPLGTSSEAPAPKPLVLVISGPSGVGKDAVINRLKEVRDEIHFVVTATTRPRRLGEVDGKDYFFVTREEFEGMIQKNELLEHAVVYGDFKGIPKRQVRDCLAKGSDVVLRVDVQGAATIRSILGSGAVFIFLVAESEAALVMRLVERKTETKDKLLLRIATAREELKRMNEFDYVVMNADGQLEKTVSLISHIIDAEKARVHQREVSL